MNSVNLPSLDTPETVTVVNYNSSRILVVRNFFGRIKLAREIQILESGDISFDNAK
jgi:hypothetical protein